MEKLKNQLQISVSNGSFVDNGDGLVSFPLGLTITDDSEMRSGTRYDIKTLDVSKYQGQLTADHEDDLDRLIGKVNGLTKVGNRVYIQGIKYAVDANPYARLAYDLLVGGFSNSFSIETLGGWPDPQDPVYRDHELVGLSQVVVPNNYNAKINQFNEIVRNSLERSQRDGLDTAGIEEKILEVTENKAISTSLPVDEDLNASWDGGGALKRVKAWASDSEGNIDFTKYRKAFLWVDPADKNLQGGYKLGFADIVDGELKAIWKGVSTAMAVLNGSMGGVDIPDADRAGVYRVIAGYYKKFKKDLPELNAVDEENMNKNDIPTIENNVETEEVETPKVETEVVAEEIEVVEPEVEVEKPQPEVTKPEVETPEVVEPVKTEPEDNSAEPEKVPVEPKTEIKEEEKLEMTADQIAEIVANAIKPFADDLTATRKLAQDALDVQAKEPEFTPEVKVENSLDGLSAEQLFSKQLNAAVAYERMGSVEGAKTLHDINARNLQALKEAKIVNAALTLEDLGNFVIAPELYNQVVGVRTDYSKLLDATQWKETQSLQFGWLTRSRDIDMSNVAIGALGDVSSPDTTNKRLKPISTPAYGAHTDSLEELAAVTPISVNVIKFAAADILSDVAEGYRNDYDRKRAQLVIVRLQQAVNATGNKHVFDISNGLVGWAQVVALLSDVTTVGTLIFNSRTLAMIKGQAIDNFANVTVLSEMATGSILGTPFIVVPNDLLPTLNAAETRTFPVHGVNVTVDQAVFYGDLRTFTGRTSGGLKYDVDGSASYELNGVTYSAYQRNEVVLRGSFFRGGVVKDINVVAGIPAVAVS